MHLTVADRKIGSATGYWYSLLDRRLCSVNMTLDAENQHFKTTSRKDEELAV